LLTATTDVGKFTHDINSPHTTVSATVQRGAENRVSGLANQETVKYFTR